MITAVFCAAMALAGTAVAQTRPIVLHSRHIPASHLALNDFARAARTETHTTCLDPDKIGNLVRWGVDTIELRLCWWMLEKKPGVLDFLRLDSDLAKVEAALGEFRKRGGVVSDGLEYDEIPRHIVYRTRHLDYDSSFDPETCKIEFSRKCD